jgi:hypothetical protein
MYDMKPMAESLASQGRYGDSMLVHMNPVEVAGLRAAAKRMGGDLTTNPRTGQPEAFLPFLLGMGLQGLGMSALGAGIATGLGTAAVTGDLGKGVMAGLGAYGGAGIGEGLGAASGAVEATQVTPGMSFPEAGLPSGAPSPMLPPNPSVGPASFAPTPAAPPIMPADVMTPAGDIGLASSSAPGATPLSYTQPVAPPSPLAEPVATGTEMAINESLMPPSKGSLAGLEGVMSTGPTGEAARGAFMQEVGGGTGLLTKTAFGLAPYALEQPDFNPPKQDSLIRPYDYDPTTRRFTAGTPYRAPGPEYMAQGGLAGLTGYKEGNILRGQGDGMSDEIKASIDGEQDVLLSDGEYVIPADAVAMLGNGSTDAGANRLDAMIARLRTQKYGRNKQPPEMKAESVMPA